MPYVSSEDRVYLDPLIVKLCEKTVSLSLRGREGDADAVECAVLDYMHYVAEKVLVESGLAAAWQYQGERRMRYWLIVDQAGIALNIAFELFDRMRELEGLSESEEHSFFDWLEVEGGVPPADVAELDQEIDDLLLRIAMDAGPRGYNYDGAYAGLVNYSMTELMPRVLKGVRDSQEAPFDSFDVMLLVEFWGRVARRLYRFVARPYEGLQIKKSGDVKVYGEMREWLRG